TRPTATTISSGPTRHPPCRHDDRGRGPGRRRRRNWACGGRRHRVDRLSARARARRSAGREAGAMTGTVEKSLAGGMARHWPWLLLAVVAAAAAWHAVDFEDDIDPEFPGVVRPTFSRRPPSAYRLAEPGDTIDRIALYAASGAVVLATIGLIRSLRRTRGIHLWAGALGLALAGHPTSPTRGPLRVRLDRLGCRARPGRAAHR